MDWSLDNIFFLELGKKIGHGAQVEILHVPSK